ncbi:MAG: hypothetical protein HDR92_06675 [Bacteroides sp.]|nr:hypothetical protein [Bacteroides sp.]
MEITELDSLTYRRTFPDPAVAYNSAAFTDLNAWKVEELRHLLLSKGGRPMFGLTVGLTTDEGFRAPFSAPFACFDFNRNQKAAAVYEAVVALAGSFPGLRITLPPAFYSPDMISKMELSFIQSGGTVCHADWNCHIELAGFSHYKEIIASYERNILCRAEQAGYTLKRVDSEPERAYKVVLENHLHRGYPVRMTLDQLIATTSGINPAVSAYYFVLNNGSDDAASAIVYDVTPDIVQVIYWGDSPHSKCRFAMNLLAAKLTEFFKNAGKRILDIGPSSEGGILSAGLCSFKERVGCSLTPKFTFQLPAAR